MKTIIKAEIVAHSINEQGDELISVMATFPRFILAEVNTHRMLSKNTSSSRAIPFAKMVEAIKNDPFIPIAWQKHHSGMQGNEYWDVTIKGEPGELDHTNIPAKWLRARDTAVTMAEVLYDGPQGVTKQLCNRLLEPFMWTTMLITGPKSGWDNFFNLRCPNYSWIDVETIQGFKSKKDMIFHWKENNFHGLPEINDELGWLKLNKGQAEIHMMALAECIYDAYIESKPEKLEAGEWHIPFKSKMNFEKLGNASAHYFNKGGKLLTPSTSAVAVSVAMAARTSYTVVGEEKALDYEAMIGLHDRLLTWDPPHSSPLEHCARAMTSFEYFSYIKGKLHNPEFQGSEGEVIDYLVGIEESSMGWCNNLKGFIPYRYLVDNGQQI